MKLAATSALDRARTSLFFLPLLAVISAIVLGFTGVWADSSLDDPSRSIPLVLTSTVDSARAILQTVAAATISFAGVAFSIALLVIQLTSSQYSPRAIHTLFRDPFNRRVMALVVGTFTYCIIVLRAVRAPLGDSGEAVIPNLAVAFAVVLGLASILATVAFIDHSAHTMDVSQVLRRAAHESVAHLRSAWGEVSTTTTERSGTELGELPPTGVGEVFRFEASGWVQHIDVDALLELVPERGRIDLETYPGRYGVAGAPMAVAHGPVADLDRFGEHLRRSVTQGPSRTVDQDASYGLRQIVDIALRALSPGVNDPTTAQDAIFHATGVLVEMLSREPPTALHRGPQERVLVVRLAPTHDDMIDLAFDELRPCAAQQPAVAMYLLESMSTIDEVLQARGLPDRSRRVREQAAQLIAGLDRSAIFDADLARVLRHHHDRFAHQS